MTRKEDQLISKRPRWNHVSAFKAKVALEALKTDPSIVAVGTTLLGASQPYLGMEEAAFGNAAGILSRDKMPEQVPIARSGEICSLKFPPKWGRFTPPQTYEAYFAQFSIFRLLM